MIHKPPKILVVGPAWVGDMVMAHSLFMTLKAHQPLAQIDVLAPQWSQALLERMPEVTEMVTMPLGHGTFDLKTRFTLGRRLMNAGYTQAILLPNSWKSALVPFFAHIPLRTGYVGEYRWGLLNDSRKLDKVQLSMTVQRFVALGLAKYEKFPAHYPMPKLSIDKEKQKAVRQHFNLKTTDKILALCTGAEYGEAKRWPANYYADIATQKIQQGWQVWLFGSVKDKPVTEQINYATKNKCIDLAGKTSLAEAVDLMSLVDTVVSNDSGLMHVAAALDKKLIAIYGSSDPHFTPPLNNKAKIIYLNLACSPCFKRKCPLTHTHCLNKIMPETILAEIDH